MPLRAPVPLRAQLPADGVLAGPRGLLAIELQVVRLELVLLVLVLYLLARERNLAAGLVGDAEVLDQLVAFVFVERGLVGDKHPVGALELLRVEDLVVDLRRVIDDDQDLRLWVEVGARTDRELIHLEAPRVAHGAFIPTRSTRC